jgi:hypothetical protein
LTAVAPAARVLFVPIDSDLERRLRALETNVAGLVKVNRELIANVALIAATRGQLDEADRDKMLEVLDEVHAFLARISEFLPDVGD